MNLGKSFITKILVGFFLMRIMTIMWYQPVYSEFLDYHFLLAESSGKGYYPFLHYWMEYPPVFPWVSVAIYQFVANIFSTPYFIKYFYFVLISSIMILAETGILYLCFAQAKKLYNIDVAEKCCIFYLLLFFPLCGSASYFDSFPAFFLFFAIYLILQQKNIAASICIALGAMIKIIPVVLLPILWLTSKNRLRVILVFTVVVFIILLPFLFYDSSWVATFGQVTVQRQGWETPWALIDNQYSFGYLGPIPQQANKNTLAESRFLSRFSTDTSFLHQSSELFSKIYLFAGILFLVLFIYLYMHLPKNISEYSLFCFATCSLLLFFLYSKGWSPQFLIYLIPFFIVALPEKFYVLLFLSVINFIELRIWLFFFPSSVSFLTILILIRTCLFVYLLVILGKRIYKEQVCQPIPPKESILSESP